jgi:hypothetical protein
VKRSATEVREGVVNHGKMAVNLRRSMYETWIEAIESQKTESKDALFYIASTISLIAQFNWVFRGFKYSNNN